jgi:phage baseplate assembly protein W
MPIPQTVRIDPLDLQKNIAIGVSLPFNGPAGPFNKTYSTQEQAKFDLINLLLTNKGERVFNPEFGTDLRPVLFEPITEDIVPLIRNIVTTSVDTYVPAIIVSDVTVKKDEDNNTISITVTYRMRVSGQADQITVQFI